MSVEWDPLDPAFKVDPYRTYCSLLQEQPLYKSRYGPLLVLRYEDCVTMLRHPAASNDVFRKTPGWSPPPDVPPEIFISSIVSDDPPDHTRVRSLVDRAFNPRRIEGLRSVMQQIVDRALDQAADRHGMEVVGELAFPLPVNIICALLGVPTEDIKQFKVWAASMVRSVDPEFTLSPELQAQLAASYKEMWDYFLELVATRRENPGNDLLSALVKLEGQSDYSSTAELMVNIILLLVAGHETTVNLLANGVLAFARHPGQFERLRQDPSLARSTVEEVLRFYPPVHLRPRLALADIELSAGAVPAFTNVFVVFPAANRDPRQFDNPQAFDIGRLNNRHLAFGFGIHHCIGAPLARMEGEVVFSALARRFSKIELIRDPPLYKENVSIPGVAELEVDLAT